MPTRIVPIISSLTTGGAEMSLLRLCKQQVQRYQRVTVISLQPKSELYQQFIDAGVSVVCLDMTKASQLLAVTWKLRSAIKAAKPEIVQSWMYYSNALAALACMGLGIKLIWSIRRTEVPVKSTFSALFMRCCALLSHWLPAKVCYNARAGISAHEQFGYATDKSELIANGFEFVPRSRFDEGRVEARAKLGISTQDTVIICVARWHPDKGQDLLIQALASVGNTLADVKLLLVGRDCTESNDELTALITQYQLKERVILVGEQMPVSSWLVLADLYCMPSRTEGFPNALVEAMALDVPAVATAVGDTPIITETLLQLVPPRADALAEAITAAVATPATERLQHAVRAGVLIRQQFAISACADSYDKLYRQVLEC